MMAEFQCIPKGGMCAVCVYRDRNCSDIDFRRCRVIQVDKVERVKVVKCSRFVRG